MRQRREWILIVKLMSPETLRQFLRFRDLSYGQLAKRVNCSKAMIGHLATGKRTRTSGELAKAICRELDVPVDSLFLPDLSSIKEAGSHTSNVRGVGRKSA